MRLQRGFSRKSSHLSHFIQGRSYGDDPGSGHGGNHDPFTSVLPADAAGAAFFSLQVATVQARADAATEYQIQTFPLERNGVALHLQRLAVAGTQPQRQILLVHGLTYSSHEFDVNYADYSLARYLAARGFAVWTFDVAGYGESQEVEDGFMPNSDYAAEDAAAAAAEILKVSGQKKLDVLGWSWGTVTSSRFVARHPEMVKKLVLYAPIMVGLGAAEVKVPFNHNTWLHAAGDFQTTKDGAIDYTIVDPQVVAVFQSNCWRYDKDSSPNGGRRDLLVSAETPLIDPAAIRVPTLVIGGDKDPYLNLDSMRAAMSKLPSGSKLEIMPGAAHAMMMEKPYYKEFRQKVVEFLEH